MRLSFKATLILGIAVLGFSIAACGGNDNGNSGGDGNWRGETVEGTALTLTLWIDPADPDLADFERFREATGANPVLYGRVVATNEASAGDTARFVSLTGPDGLQFDGSEIEVNFACSHVGRWIAGVTELTNDLNEQYQALANDHCGGSLAVGPAIAPGETVTYYVAYEADAEPAFERVFMGIMNELER